MRNAHHVGELATVTVVLESVRLVPESTTRGYHEIKMRLMYAKVATAHPSIRTGHGIYFLGYGNQSSLRT
jgi:hypothetical protein